MTATLPQVVTEPGIYDLTDEQYHRDPVPGGSLSSSGARRLLPPNCPARFRYEQLHGRAPKAAFDLGHAAHLEVLGVGPELSIVHADNWLTKAAKEARAAAYADGKVPVLADQHRQVQAMAAAIRAHRLAGALLRDGDAERSLFWTDPATDVWCRARHDWATHRSSRLFIVDVKTCEKADRESVRRSISTYRYYMQAAFYIDGAIALGLDDDPAFLLAFVEKSAPHLVNVVQLDADAIDSGRALNRQAIDLYAKCVADDHWPGYPDDEIDLISLPPWAVRHDNEEFPS